MLFLSEADRRALLELARLAVHEAVLRGRLVERIPTDGVFSQQRGVFVTLHSGARLRGCIGVTESVEPLGFALVRCAASAALHDSRFSATLPEELPHLLIELSLLSQLWPMRPEEIEPGRHGVVIVSGKNRGVLLPQVAIEYCLHREQFLSETCRKAGLGREAWRDPDTRIYGFTCEVFSEPIPFEATDRA